MRHRVGGSLGGPQREAAIWILVVVVLLGALPLALYTATGHGPRSVLTAAGIQWLVLLGLASWIRVEWEQVARFASAPRSSLVVVVEVGGSEVSRFELGRGEDAPPDAIPVAGWAVAPAREPSDAPRLHVVLDDALSRIEAPPGDWAGLSTGEAAARVGEILTVAYAPTGAPRLPRIAAALVRADAVRTRPSSLAIPLARQIEWIAPGTVAELVEPIVGR